MLRRKFLFLTLTLFQPAKPSLTSLVKEISERDKEYSRTCKLVVERSRYFSPLTDPTIKGWFRKLSQLSEEIAERFKALADL